MNAGRGHQAPRKAVHCLQKEVGKNIKDKKRDKRGRDGAPSQDGSLKKDRSFQKSGKTLTAKSVESLGTIEGNITRKKSKQIIKTHRFTCPTVTPSREAVQMPVSATSKWGLGQGGTGCIA